MNLKLRKIEFNDIPAAEVDFWEQVRISQDAADEIYQELSNFFDDQSSTTVYKDFYWSYWRWFTEMMWARSGNFESAVFANQLLAKQVPIALALGYDVWDALIWHLHFRTPFSDDMASAYSSFKKAFFESDAIVGSYKGVLVAVKDLIPEIEKINRSGANSLETAETMSKIHACFADYSNRSELVNYFVKPEKSTDLFVGLVNFFLGVKPERILYVVDVYVHDSTATDKTAEPVVETQGEMAREADVAGGVVAEQMTPKTNYADIKAMIEARFTRDASGEFTNLDGVLALLDSLATEQGDEQVRDLYYFDEGAGKFQWNEALLT